MVGASSLTRRNPGGPDDLGNLPVEYPEAQDRGPGKYRPPEYYAGDHPEQERAGGGSERQGEDGGEWRAGEHGGLQGNPDHPEALPHALYAIPAAAEPGTTVDPAPQPLAGPGYEQNTNYAAHCGRCPGHDGRKPGNEARRNTDPEVYRPEGRRREEPKK